MENSSVSKGLMSIFFSGKSSAVDCFTRCAFSKIKGWGIKINILHLNALISKLMKSLLVVDNT